MGAMPSSFEDVKVQAKAAVEYAKAKLKEFEAATNNYASALAKEKDEPKDTRRRNSLAFYINQYVTFEGEEFKELVEEIDRDQADPKKGKKKIRHSKFSRLADSILEGNYKELRNQTVVQFGNINREYKDHHLDNTLLHMVCQEGYYQMLTFMEDPHNHSELDTNELFIEPKNIKNRTPLLLCFTPPTATWVGQKHGVDNDGAPMAQKPDDIEVPADWIKPGGPKSREQCVKLLVSRGADVNQKDFHDYTVLHYAVMWNWMSTVKFLIKGGADINAQTVAGKTALMMATDMRYDSMIIFLISKKGIDLDVTDTDGYTALCRCIEKGEEYLDICKVLLAAGADPNVITIRRRTALKIACAVGNMKQINLLLDNKAYRRQSAFDLLLDEKLSKVLNNRLERDEKLEAETHAEQSRMAAVTKGKTAKVSEKENPMGAWLDFRERKTETVFYYNTISRKCQREKPKDFKALKNRVVPEAVYGLHFYHSA